MPETHNLEDVLEKRHHFRVVCHSPVQVALPADPEPARGALLDVSPGGMRMRLNRPLRPDHEYPVYVASDAGGDTTVVSARPVWVRATPDGCGFDVGCRFVDGSAVPEALRDSLLALEGLQKRRTLRLPASCDVTLRCDKRKLEAVSTDVSYNGAGLVCYEALSTGTRLQARFDFTPHGAFRAPVEIVYCSPCPGESGRYAVGVTFLPMEPKESRRLSSVLYRLRATNRWRVVEAEENRRWTDEIHRFAESQPPEVATALRQIVANAERLSQYLVHAGHDELLATIAKIDRARTQPVGAIRRERLDAPIANFGDVVPGKLCRGGQPFPEGLRWLKAQGIRSIILLREPAVEKTNYPGYRWTDYIKDIEDLGLRCIEMPMRDGTIPTPQQIDAFMAAVNAPEHRPVYVHCAAGVGRTGIMAGLYLKSQGVAVEEVIDQSRRFLMNPDLKADHALQASFLATYPIGAPQPVPSSANCPRPGSRFHPIVEAFSRGHGVVLPEARLDTSRALADLEAALRQGTSYEIAGNVVMIDGVEYVVNAQPLDVYGEAGLPSRNPYELHPGILIRRALEVGLFLKLDFLCPDVVDSLASMARVIPNSQKMGQARVRELDVGGMGRTLLTLEDTDRARDLLGGDVFFQLTCAGLTPETLTPEVALDLAGRVAGHGQVIDFNLPCGADPPLPIVRSVWEKHGVACAIRIHSAADKGYWDAQKVPYLATADDAALATRLSTLQ